MAFPEDQCVAVGVAIQDGDGGDGGDGGANHSSSRYSCCRGVGGEGTCHLRSCKGVVVAAAAAHGGVGDHHGAAAAVVVVAGGALH